MRAVTGGLSLLLLGGNKLVDALLHLGRNTKPDFYSLTVETQRCVSAN